MIGKNLEHNLIFELMQKPKNFDCSVQKQE